MKTTEPLLIDAVITWVDGKEPKHKDKIQKYLKDKTVLNSKELTNRFNQVNEIEYCVKSILKYAKFVRTIYIVTDKQVPAFLTENSHLYPTVKIVDHTEIFRDHLEYLPTFNSRSIETLLYKIPNLSEHFIYLNDDTFFLKETKIEDFFINQQPILRGFWKTFNEDIFIKKLKYVFQKKSKTKRPSHKLAQETGAKVFGFKKYYKFHHIAHPIRKSSLATFFDNNKEILEKNIKYKFRNIEQFTIQSLANHLEIKNKTGVLLNDYQLIYFQNYKKPFFWLKSKLEKAKNTQTKLFLCMQSLDVCPPNKLVFIKDWLHKKYNV
ncbi:stealth family protein [uncultured Polaribacter sp.]|uniref:stealth family protein n=1 Tax=uncultured Polaribacter sp. TaxID=174711 RepID=UPI002627906A|nr:stealth family protein [uncultured Polaribacter sp.]